MNIKKKNLYKFLTLLFLHYLRKAYCETKLYHGIKYYIVISPNLNHCRLVFLGFAPLNFKIINDFMKSFIMNCLCSAFLHVLNTTTTLYVHSNVKVCACFVSLLINSGFSSKLLAHMLLFLSPHLAHPLRKRSASRQFKVWAVSLSPSMSAFPLSVSWSDVRQGLDRSPRLKSQGIRFHLLLARQLVSVGQPDVMWCDVSQRWARPHVCAFYKSANV